MKFLRHNKNVLNNEFNMEGCFVLSYEQLLNVNGAGGGSSGGGSGPSGGSSSSSSSSSSSKPSSSGSSSSSSSGSKYVENSNAGVAGANPGDKIIKLDKTEVTLTQADITWAQNQIKKDSSANSSGTTSTSSGNSSSGSNNGNSVLTQEWIDSTVPAQYKDAAQVALQRQNEGKNNSSSSGNNSSSTPSSSNSSSSSGSSSSSSSSSVTVKSGDTLGNLVSAYNKEHGTHYTVNEIAKANNIKDADKIEIGQTITFFDLDPVLSIEKNENVSTGGTDNLNELKVNYVQNTESGIAKAKPGDIIFDGKGKKEKLTQKAIDEAKTKVKNLNSGYNEAGTIKIKPETVKNPTNTISKIENSIAENWNKQYNYITGYRCDNWVEEVLNDAKIDNASSYLTAGKADSKSVAEHIKELQKKKEGVDYTKTRPTNDGAYVVFMDDFFDSKGNELGEHAAILVVKNGIATFYDNSSGNHKNTAIYETDKTGAIVYDKSNNPKIAYCEQGVDATAGNVSWGYKTMYFQEIK